MVEDNDIPVSEATTTLLIPPPVDPNEPEWL